MVWGLDGMVGVGGVFGLEGFVGGGIARVVLDEVRRVGWVLSDVGSRGVVGVLRVGGVDWLKSPGVFLVEGLLLSSESVGNVSSISTVGTGVVVVFVILGVVGVLGCSFGDFDDKGVLIEEDCDNGVDDDDDGVGGDDDSVAAVVFLLVFDNFGGGLETVFEENWGSEEEEKKYDDEIDEDIEETLSDAGDSVDFSRCV